MTATGTGSDASHARVAFVTGGSRGIGRAIVTALLDDDWTVFFCSRSERSVAATLDALAARHAGRVFARAVDVRDAEAVAAAVGWVVETAGRIDCLVNNAGLGVFGPVDEISPETWRRVLRTNLDSAFYATHAAAPIMKRQGAGWIVNIASLAGLNSIPGGAAYNASKFGMLGLSDASMLDLRPHGVRVCAVLPGSVDTDFFTDGGEGSWRLRAEDVARAVTDLLRYPDRALPSRIELRPARVP